MFHSPYTRTCSMRKATVSLHSFVVVLLLSNACLPVQGFAAWLKCYIDLHDDTEVIMNHLIVPADKANHVVAIQVKTAEDDHWSSTLAYPSDRTTVVTARLAVPPELSHSDIQWVIEASDGAIFLRTKMCEGRRSHASQYSESVVLEIDGTKATVDLVAGYASGHEAVTLTESVVLTRREEGEL